MAALPALDALGWATATHGTSLVWWPAAPVSWLLIAMSRPRARPFFALFILGAAVVTGSWFGVPPSLGLAEGVGDVVAGLLLSRLLSSRGQPESLRRQVALWAKILLGVVASTVAIGAVHLALGQGGWVAETPPRLMARLTGVVCAAPFIRVAWRAFEWRRLFGREALVAGVLLTTMGVAAHRVPAGSAELAFGFVMVMPLLWAALRLEAPTPQLGVLLVAVAASVSSHLGLGLFRGADAVLSLQVWLGFLAVMTLLAVAVTAERRAAFAELAQSEQRFRLMTENGRDVVCAHALDGTFRWVSTSSAIISGWRPEELTGRPLVPLLHPDDVPSVLGAARRLSRGHEGLTVRYRLRRKDGRYVWLESTAQYVAEAQVVQSATRDITERVRALERLRLACQSAGVVVFDWDLVRDTVVDEGRFAELLGVDISGRPDARAAYLACVHPEDRRRVGRELRAALAQERAFRFRFRTIHPTKGERHIFASGELERDERGRAVAMIGVNWDVTEQARAEETLRQARDASEAASRAKAAYLAMMSHEIRTPLGGLIGMTEELSREVGLAQRPAVDTIRRSGEALLALLNDVLDLSKMEAGKLELEAGLCELEQLVGDVRSLYWRAAQSKGLTLSVQLAADASRLLADPLRVRQVLSNLVSNAVKFTAHGGVAIRSWRGEADDAFPSGSLALEVSDTGIGIPADRLGRLFQEFSQADITTSRRYGGTGLGLAISKRLVSAMSGRISVSSVAGQGSTFVVKLPQVSEEQLSTASAASRAEPAELEGLSLPGCRVLLAEDNPINRRVAVGLLERLGCQVHPVENGREAVDAWRAGEWDVVVMDMQMPELDGLEATRRIRELEEKERRTPILIVAMTANAFKEDRDACLAAGMNDVVTKPATKKSLHAALARWVDCRAELPLRASA